MLYQSIDSYNIIRAGHPCKQKRGGVCIYFEEQLNLKQIITHYFSQCIIVRYQRKIKKAILLSYMAASVKQLVNLIVFWKILKNLCTRFNTSDHPL